jgi:hypothetical protein
MRRLIFSNPDQAIENFKNLVSKIGNKERLEFLF